MTNPVPPDEAARQAVEAQRRVTRAEASPRGLRRERDLAVYMAVRAGVSYDDLAPALGVGTQTIGDIVRRLEREGEPQASHPEVVPGTLAAARLVEPAMMLLLSLAYAGTPRDLGLRLLEREV
jgi:hypothetical protein